MRNEVEVAIVGAGPYGLSIAAHLRARKVEFRIFGSPMHTWMNQMPAGMCLKSEGFASTLYDPDSSLTLEGFCRERNIPYAHLGLPVHLDTFVSYGLEFQRRLIPELEDRQVISLERSATGFRMQLNSGETAFARKVVIAVGISHFEYLPPILSGLPEELVTHSSQHTSLRRFQGRDVSIIGAGASALDLAALVREAGATVRVIARKPMIHFHNPPGPLPRPWFDRVRAPMTGLGPGWRSFMCVKAPLVFHGMPEKFRLEVVRRHLGPAPAWFTKEAVVGRVELNVDTALQEVAIDKQRVRLRVAKSSGESRWIETDHVIAGTGYRVDLERLKFLNGLEHRFGLRVRRRCFRASSSRAWRECISWERPQRPVSDPCCDLRMERGTPPAGFRNTWSARGQGARCLQGSQKLRKKRLQEGEEPTPSKRENQRDS